MAEELNQMSLINNLPDELLILQFKSFLNDMARIFAPQDARTRQLDIYFLLLLTRVCRRWRDLVIGFPAFWTRVDNDNIDRFNEFTRRSRDLPLSLRLTIKEHISDASTILRSYGQRIHRLAFALSLESCDITPLLDQAVPNHLECLIIAYDDHSESDDMPLAYRHLNPHICSSLSALSLRPATSWFPIEARFPNLTHLYLSAADTFFGIGGILNKPPLFPLLKKTPKLEFLHIVRPQALNLSDHGAVNGSGTVVLPKLRSCVLVGGDVDSCFSIISQCSMPRTVWIRLDQVLRHPFNNDLIQLPSLPMKNQITHLEVAMHLAQLHVRAEAPMGGVWLNTNLNDSHLINDTGVWRSWLCSLLETSVFPNLTSLHIDGIDSSTLAPLLRSTPQVTHLGVRLRTTWCDEPHRPGGAPQDHGFIHVLGSLDQDTGALLLPALESLAFDALHRHIWLDPEDVDDYSVGADAIAPNPSLERSPEDISSPTTASRIAFHGSDHQESHGLATDADAVPLYALPPASLIAALSARARAGKPVKRLVYQNWEKTPDKPLRSQYSDGIAKFLRDATKGVVGECVVPGPDEFVVPLASQDGWCPEDAEKYWPLGKRDRPRRWFLQTNGF